LLGVAPLLLLLRGALAHLPIGFRIFAPRLLDRSGDRSSIARPFLRFVASRYADPGGAYRRGADDRRDDPTHSSDTRRARCAPDAYAGTRV